jgi:hypothetical protein
MQRIFSANLGMVAGSLLARQFHLAIIIASKYDAHV